MNYIIILGAFQSLLAIFLFMYGRKKHEADNILTLMLCCLFMHLSIKFIIFSVSGIQEIKAGFNTFTDLAYGPMIWMYASKVKNRHFNPVKNWYHFIPALLAGIVYLTIVFYLCTGGTLYTQIVATYNRITTYIILSSILLYPCFALYQVQRVPAFWNAEKRLIKQIAFIYIGMSIASIISINLHFQDNETSRLAVINFRIFAYSMALTVCLAIIRYRLTSLVGNWDASEEEQAIIIKEQEVVSQEVLSAAFTEQVAPVAPQPVKRPALMSGEYQISIIERITILMQQKKAYRDPELTLDKLAMETKIPRNYISEALNQYLGKSFYQFINEFRITEVIAMLDKCKKQQVSPNILSIAYDAGFNSKSSFNQYFKKATGLTPSEYLKDSKPLVAAIENTILVKMVTGS